MKVLVMVNVEEMSGAFTQAKLIARYFNAPMFHYVPLDRGSKVLEGEVDGIVAYYPVSSIAESLCVLSPDVLVVHSLSTNLVNELEMVKKICKVIYVCHANPIEMIINDQMRNYFEYMVYMLNNADMVIAVSNHQQVFLKNFMKNGRITTISPAIEYDLLRNVEPSPRDAEFIMAGRIDSIKNHMSAFMAVKKLSEKYPNVFMKVFGNGVLTNFYNNVRCSMGLEDNVGLYGNISHNELITEMCHSIALVNTSISENKPLVELEAMAIGIPIVRNYNQMLNAIENPESLEYQINLNKRLAKNYDIKKVGKRYKKWIRKLL